MGWFKKKFPKKDEIRVQDTENSWSVGTFQGPEGPVIVRANQGYKHLVGHPEFKSWIFITTAYDYRHDGMPTEEEMQQLDALETEIETALGAGNEALLCAVHTGGGKRMWLYYFTDFAILQSRLDPIIQNSGRAWELPWDDDPEWKQYRQFVR